MKSPKISVVTITYGHEAYIEETLNGILLQQYDGEIEVIIANDNSPDQTDAVVRRFLNREDLPTNIQFHYTKHSENKGMMPNFIWALEQCTGKYIALCEGDDYWTDPLKLQKQVDFLENNSDYTICSAKAQIVENNIPTEIIGNVGTYTFDDFITNNNLITCTILFKNTPLHLQYLKDVYFGDWMLYCLILNASPNKKAIVLDETFSNYRIHSGGAMAQLNDISNIEKHLLQIERIHHFFRPTYQSKNIMVIKNYIMKIYIYYLKNKDYKRARNTVLLCFKLIKLNTPIKKIVSYYKYRNQL